jgi:hypothetical protein
LISLWCLASFQAQLLAFLTSALPLRLVLNQTSTLLFRLFHLLFVILLINDLEQLRGPSDEVRVADQAVSAPSDNLRFSKATKSRVVGGERGLLLALALVRGSLLLTLGAGRVVVVGRVGVARLQGGEIASEVDGRIVLVLLEVGDVEPFLRCLIEDLDMRGVVRLSRGRMLVKALLGRDVRSVFRKGGE